MEENSELKKRIHNEDCIPGIPTQADVTPCAYLKEEKPPTKQTYEIYQQSQYLYINYWTKEE
jgi:CDP-diacylglycerol pyrophosphatase